MSPKGRKTGLGFKGGQRIRSQIALDKIIKSLQPISCSKGLPAAR